MLATTGATAGATVAFEEVDGEPEAAGRGAVDCPATGAAAAAAAFGGPEPG